MAARGDSVSAVQNARGVKAHLTSRESCDKPNIYREQKTCDDCDENYPCSRDSEKTETFAAKVL